jgi:hypothetical protein
LEGIDATPIEGYHLYWKDDQAPFWFCPVPAGDKKRLEKLTGRSFHHGKFVGRHPHCRSSRAQCHSRRDHRRGGAERREDWCCYWSGLLTPRRSPT